MTWVTLLFCHFCTGILNIILSRKKNRALLPWFLVTLPLGVLALFLLLALPPNPEKTEANLESPSP